ncbi:MAG: PKD domain-containing protein, partial [Pyrinomonadaceae bacterium]
MKRTILGSIAFLICLSVFGMLSTTATSTHQGADFTGSNYARVELPNASPFTSVGSWRLELRVRGLTPHATNAQDVFTVEGPSGFTLRMQSAGNGSVLQLFGRSAPTLTVPGSWSRSDALVRVQWDQANSYFTLEVWNADGTGYAASPVSTSTDVSAMNFGGQRVGVGALYNGSLHATCKVDFVRWQTGALAVGSHPPAKPTGAETWLVDYELEGGLTDSSGVAGSLNTPAGTVNFVTTPATNPYVYAGPDAEKNAPASGSITAFASAPDEAITGYSWTRTSGSGGSLSGTSTATLAHADLPAGTHTMQVTATSAEGTTRSDSVNVVVYPAPVATITTANFSVVRGQPFTIDGSASTGSGLLWDLGDGSKSGDRITRHNEIVTHAYRTTGAKTVTLNAYNALGVVSSPATITVTVSEPVVTDDPYPVTASG